MEEFYNSESHILWVIYGRFDGGKHVLPYPLQNDWVFASPFTRGERPYWPDSVLKNHVRRAAIAAGITKTIGWHTFRHSVGSHLGQSGENVKVVEELLRHASSRITQDVYQQADQGARRSALGRFPEFCLSPRRKRRSKRGT